MAGPEEEGTGAIVRFVEALRGTERGVWYFLLFIALMAIGFALVIAGHFASGAVLGILAFMFLMAMVLATPRYAISEGEVGQGEGEERGVPREPVELEEESEADRLSREAAPAPTRAARRAPAPPPEPPPEDDVVVDLE